MSTAANPVSAFDPDEFHKQYTRRNASSQFTIEDAPTYTIDDAPDFIPAKAPDVFDEAASRMPQNYISTDPNAGEDPQRYLSTDPNAGDVFDQAGTDTAPWEDYAQQGGPWQDYGSKSSASSRAPVGNPLVTGKGMVNYARRQAATAVRGPLDRAVTPGERAPGEKPNPVSRFSEITMGSPHPLDALAQDDLPAMIAAPGAYAKNLTAAEVKGPARLAYSSVTHPIDTAVSLTGGPQFSDDIHAGHYGSAAADVLGGAANAYGILRGAESLPRPELPFDLPSKQSIASTFRTENNALRPGVKAVGKVGGAAAGGLLGHVAGPYGGYVGTGVGALAGPSVLDSIIPDRLKILEPPEPELGSPENPGWMAPLPNRMPKAAQSNPELGSPENPGWVAPLPNRMPKQSAESPRSIVAPGERAPARTGSEGSAARWKNDDAMRILRDPLSDMADKREAAMTLTRRGISLPDNYRYLLGDQTSGAATYSPRNITKFTPEGTPIRQGGKRLSQ